MLNFGSVLIQTIVTLFLVKNDVNLCNTVADSCVLSFWVNIELDAEATEFEYNNYTT